MSKRGNGEGSLFRMKDGRWKVMLSVPAKGGCKRRRISRNARTRADAVAILAKLRASILSGGYAESSHVSVQHFLNQWLDGHVQSHKSPATEAVCRSMVTNYIAPALGEIRLQRLSPGDVQQFADQLASESKDTRSRQLAFSVLRRAMRHAVKIGMIGFDPTEDIDKPAHQKKDIHPFSDVEASRLFNATRGTRWHALIVLSITCGFRQGELFGLEWSAVDLTERKIRVLQAAAEVKGRVTIRRPKTKAGIRVVELTPVAVDALQAHRAIMLKEGNAGSPYVFCAPEGGLMGRSTFRHRYWIRLLDKLKLARRGFHHCRHSYASIALGMNVPVHVVARVMGHARPSTTLDIYAHCLKSQQDAATEAMQRKFG